MAMLCPFQGRIASARCWQFPQVRFRIRLSRCCSLVKGMTLLSLSPLIVSHFPAGAVNPVPFHSIEDVVCFLVNVSIPPPVRWTAGPRGD